MPNTNPIVAAAPGVPAPNTNPIVLIEPDVPTPYIIRAANLSQNLTLSLFITLSDTGWDYDADNEIFLGSTDLFPAGAPEPEDLTLGVGNALIGVTLDINTSVSKIYPAGSQTGPNTKALFLMIIKADGVKLDSFFLLSGTDTVSEFYAQLIFRTA
jgi:hypothetical protein